MQALARALICQGAKVTGSDISDSLTLHRLADLGAGCWVGHNPARLDDHISLVVASAAIKPDDPELLEARRRGLEVVKYAQLLGMLMTQRTGLAISGTHGKSTTTAMLAFILRSEALDPSFVIGADVQQLGGACDIGSGTFFVAEACEYDSSFLNLAPACAAILNIEEDHLDYYQDLEAIVRAFGDFAQKVHPAGLLVVNAQDPRCIQAADNAHAVVETFGIGVSAHWQAQDWHLVDGRYKFAITYQGNEILTTHLALPGKHNMANALAAAAIAYHCGVKPSTIADCLASFAGADRRLTLKARQNDITILDDYAHHPTEIRASLQAARQCYEPKRIWCIFQPHQHSRTRFLLENFAESLAAADRVVVPDIFFVRDSLAERSAVNSGDLVARIAQLGGLACYLPRFDQILQYLKPQLAPGDLVITMGAGDVWKICDELVRWLGTDTN